VQVALKVWRYDAASGERRLQEYVIKAYGADAVREPASAPAPPREAVTA